MQYSMLIGPFFNGPISIEYFRVVYSTYSTTYLQSNYSTNDNKNHQNGFGEHVSNYWRCEN